MYITPWHDAYLLTIPLHDALLGICTQPLVMMHCLVSVHHDKGLCTDTKQCIMQRDCQQICIMPRGCVTCVQIPSSALCQGVVYRYQVVHHTTGLCTYT